MPKLPEISIAKAHRLKWYGCEIAEHFKKHRAPPAKACVLPSEAQDHLGEPAFWYDVPSHHVLAVELLTGDLPFQRKVPAIVFEHEAESAPHLVWIIGANAGNGPGGRFDLEDGTCLATMTVTLGRPYAGVIESLKV